MTESFVLLIGLLLMGLAFRAATRMTARDSLACRAGPAFTMLTGWMLVVAKIARPDLMPVAAVCLAVSALWLAATQRRRARAPQQQTVQREGGR
jgi:hypothetical protein